MADEPVAVLRACAHGAALVGISLGLGHLPGILGTTLGPWLPDGSPVLWLMPLMGVAALLPWRKRRIAAPLVSLMALLLVGPLARRRMVIMACAWTVYLLMADPILRRLQARLSPNRESGPSVQTRWIIAIAWAATIYIPCAWHLIGAQLTANPVGERRGDANLLLITLDTTRADALGCYGGLPAATPVLDDLAAEGLRVARALASAPHTHPSMGTIFTARPPQMHGSVVGQPRLEAREETLAEHLKSFGYRTAGFFENPWLTREFGFDQGFDTFLSGISGEDPALAALDWMKGMLGDRAGTKRDARPFYCHVHLFDPHGPYVPRSPWIDAWSPRYVGPYVSIANETLQAAEHPGALAFSDLDRDRIRKLYAAEVAAVDVQIGRLLDSLDEQGMGEKTLVVVTADHGEELFDHGGLHHGHSLYDELLRVPLILRLPGHLPRGAVFEGTFDLQDLTPTLLELIGVPDLPRAAGTSRALALTSGAGIQARAAFAQRFLLHGRNAFTWERGPWKLILDLACDSANPWRHPAIPRAADCEPWGESGWDPKRASTSRPRAGLFDLLNDPGETQDQSSSNPAVLEAMLDELRARLAVMGPVPHGGEDHFDRATARRLRSMGYVDGADAWEDAQRQDR